MVGKGGEGIYNTESNVFIYNRSEYLKIKRWIKCF